MSSPLLCAVSRCVQARRASFDVAQFQSKQSTSFEFCGEIQNTKRYQYKLDAQASAPQNS